MQPLGEERILWLSMDDSAKWGCKVMVGADKVWWEWRYIHARLGLSMKVSGFLRKQQLIIARENAVHRRHGLSIHDIYRSDSSAKCLGSARAYSAAEDMTTSLFVLTTLLRLHGTVEAPPRLRLACTTLFHHMLCSMLPDARRTVSFDVLLARRSPEAEFQSVPLSLGIDFCIGSVVAYGARPLLELLNQDVRDVSVPIWTLLCQLSVASSENLQALFVLPGMLQSMATLMDAWASHAALRISDDDADVALLLPRLASEHKWKRMDNKTKRFITVAQARSKTSQSSRTFLRCNRTSPAFKGISLKAVINAELDVVRQHTLATRTAFQSLHRLSVSADEATFHGESTLILIAHAMKTGMTSYLPLQVIGPTDLT